MSAYRYVAFPSRKQPTVDEVEALRRAADQYAVRHAWGVNRRDGGLAVALEAEGFDAARAGDSAFARLIERWQARGCTVVDRLGFVKDASALRVDKVVNLPPGGSPAPPRNVLTERGAVTDRTLSTKTLAAVEAIGRSGLAVDRALQRIAAAQRLAAAAPYLMMLAAMAGLVLAGATISRRLQDSPRERRQQTIERVLDSPLEEELASDPSDAD
jgi:hypothetical protein